MLNFELFGLFNIVLMIARFQQMHALDFIVMFFDIGM